MKNMTMSQRMRWLAGLLYGGLSIYQMFITQGLIRGINFAELLYVPYLYIVAMMVGAGAMCVWMFAGKGIFSENQQRAVVAATALCVVFELITYSEQTSIINWTLRFVMPNLYNTPIWLYFFMVIRLMLMILAAFFVTSNREALNKAQRKREAIEAAAAKKDEAVGELIDREKTSLKKTDKTEENSEEKKEEKESDDDSAKDKQTEDEAGDKAEDEAGGEK